MTQAAVFTPQRLPRAVLAEIGVRLTLAGLLIWQAFAAGDALVAALCGLAALYHLAAAARLAAWRVARLTRLTLDPWGLTWREAGRDRRHGWAQIHGVAPTQGGRLVDRRPGITVAIGDGKGVIGHFLVPDVFVPDRHELARELDRWRDRFGGER